MPSNYCLTRPLADKFKQMIVSGNIDISRLADMSSAERRVFFTKELGERNAKEINALFESKLLLKNQKKGLVNWAKQVSGMRPEVKRDIVSRIEKMENILTPETEKAFLEDLASKRLGVGITTKEADEIIKMSNKVKSLENFSNVKERVEYGRARLELSDYVNLLGGKKAPLYANIIGVPRAIMATLDLSAPLNQGWGMLSRKEFYKNLKTMFKAAFSKGKYADIQAEIITRESYNGAKKAGLRLTSLGNNLELREEAFMTTLLDKVPGVAASQRAYTAFLNKLRLDVYDNLVNKAIKANEDVGIGSPVLEDIAKVVNIFTGGHGKTNPTVNAILFSPRKVQSSLQILNPVTYLNPKTSKTARLAALRNLIGSTGIVASIITAATFLGDDSVEYEEDPRSSDFGKIKVGDARVDISGGMSGYVIAIARIMSGETKSTVTGITTKLGEGFNRDETAVAASFIRNKFSPMASLIVDIIVGENAIGQKKTIPQSTLDRLKPMFLNNLVEIYTNDVKYREAMAILALFGSNVNIFSISEDWSSKTSQEMIQFKEKVGEDELKKANDKYNEIIKREINSVKKTDEYKNATDEEKRLIILRIKTDAKKGIFREYNFKKRSLPRRK